MKSTVNSKELKVIQTAFDGWNILELLKLGPHSRDEMVELLGIARTTIYDRLYIFMKAGLIEYFDKSNGKRGRPTRYFKLTSGGVKNV